jgi:hypothetical protein
VVDRAGEDQTQFAYERPGRQNSGMEPMRGSNHPLIDHLKRSSNGNFARIEGIHADKI